MEIINTKSVILTISTVKLLIEGSKSLAAYGSPQIINTVPYPVSGGNQIEGSTSMLIRVNEGSVYAFYTFDVLAPDFPTESYNSRFDFSTGGVDTTRLRSYVINKDDKDLLFITSKDGFFVMKFSLSQKIKQSSETSTMTPLDHLKGTNYVFIGGSKSSNGLMSRYDYTASDPLPTDATTTSLTTAHVRGVHLLGQRETDGTDSAWCSEAPEVVFLDRTSDFSSFTRKFSDGVKLPYPGEMFEILTPKKLIVRERGSGDKIAMLDYSEATITADYFQTVCGAGIGVYSMAVIEGTTKGFVGCANGVLLSSELSDGTKIKSIATGALSFRQLTILRDRRILYSAAETQSGATQAKLRLWDVRDEVSCHSSCSTCDYETISTRCTSCPVGKVLRHDGTCGESCLKSTEYVDAERKCQACDASCLTCFGGGSTGCSTCPDQKFKRSDNSCQDSCAGNEYLSGEFTCGACNSLCLACSGPLSTECSRCDLPHYSVKIDPSECKVCTRELCPRCPDSSLCSQCLSNSSLNGCPETGEYSLSTEIRGDQKSGDISIYLLIKLNSNKIQSDDLQYMIDYGHFLITASTLEFVGNATYDTSTRRLLEKGQVSKNSTRTIEYLVYRAPDVPISDQKYKTTVSLNNSVINYEQVSATSTKPNLILQNQSKLEEVVIPEVSTSQVTKAEIGKALNNTVTATKAVGTTTSIISSVLLFNSLAILAKLFQVIEFLLNLSFVNAKLGILMENVVSTLRSLKFPIKLPSDLFWPDYEEAAKDLFWKNRYKISKYEGEPFILCNETLVVMLYLLSWIVLLVLLGVEACREEGEALNEDGLTKIKKTAKIDKILGGGLSGEKKNYKITPQAMRRRGRQTINAGRSIFQKNSNFGGLRDEEREKSMSQNKNQEKDTKKSREMNFTNGTKEVVSLKNGSESNKKSTLKKALNTSRQVKEFLFLFGYFDIQFITFNELLHSDVTKIDKLVSRASLSYFLSFVCLMLLNTDLWIVINRSYTMIKKLKAKKELSELEEEDKDTYLEDIKDEEKISKQSMFFNLISMVRFSVFQLIVISMQVSPNLQTGSLLVLQVIFFGYYVMRSAMEKFQSNIFLFVKFFVFEGSVTMFLMISFVFSFENSESWFSDTFLAWFQILAAALIFLSVFAELLTLVIKVILNTIENIKEKCCKKEKNEKGKNGEIERSKEVDQDKSPEDSASSFGELNRDEDLQDGNLNSSGNREPENMFLEAGGETRALNSRRKLEQKQNSEESKNSVNQDFFEAPHSQNSPFRFPPDEEQDHQLYDDFGRIHLE